LHNPESLETLVTQDTGRRQTKHTQKQHNTTQQTKMIPPKTEVNPGGHEG